MGQYILKRLLFIIPFSLFIVFFTLVLNKHFSTPVINSESVQNHTVDGYLDAIESGNCQRRKVLHLDWPTFYFTIQSSAIPSGLRKICSNGERAFLEMLCLSNGNKNGALELYELLKSHSNKNKTIDYKRIFNSTSPTQLSKYLSEYDFGADISKKFEDYHKNPKHSAIYLPIALFHGYQNQFHFWIKNALNFDFGKSNVNNLPVSTVVFNASMRTLSFTIPAVFLLFLISSALGLLIALKRGKLSTTTLNLLYFIDAIPLFWLSILIITLTGSFYFITGSWTSSEENAFSLVNWIRTNAFAILALVIVKLPYITKQVYTSVLKIKGQAFIQTALAKGISKKQLAIKHILPNALIPIVVLFFNYLAFAFGGAFVVEVVFSIYGIGKLMADSIISNDYQVVSFILLSLVVIKMVLMVLSDTVNYLLNPTIKFE